MTNFEGVRVTPTLSGNVVGEPPAAAARVSINNAVVHSNTHAQMPDTPEARAMADAQLANPYAIALATRSYHTSIAPPDVQVAPESTLGRWRTQLDSNFKSPGFLSWAKAQGLDTRSLKLDPYLGELTGIVNGKMQTFSLKDDSGWSDVSRVLLSIARVIAPMPGQAFNYPWPDGKVPLYTVGRFYGEPIDLSPSQAASHREKLNEGAAFEFAPVGHALQRSVEALAEQGKAQGDDANRHALIAALRSQVDDAEGKIDLNNVMVPIDRRSSLFLTEQRREISVAQLLERQGHKLPVNSTEAHGLANALTFDLAHRVPGADAGGVRHIGGLLNRTELRKMKAVVDQWKLKHASQASDPQAGVGAGSLLRGLISTLATSTKKVIADNPSLALDQLIRSPEAQALGKTIQGRIKSAASPTGATEALTAALLQELDPNSGKSRFNLAGYNLYKSENVGASAAEIVKRFTAYLETKVGVEAAPLAAQLLLSAVAPELLVKNIPPELVYGSHTWADFSIAVALVEQEAPGASGNMTLSQVMNYADAQLSILDGGDELAAASADSLIAWGLANQVIKNKPQGQYTFEDVEQSLTVLKKQKKELAWARAELMKPAPTREALALAEFKRVFPGVDPTKITLRSIRDDTYRVSPLDVYMTTPIDLESWAPLNEKELPWATIKSRFSELDPDINKTFSETFEDYTKTQAAAWAIQFKYQVSLLPRAEQERINQADVTFMSVSRPFLGTEETNSSQLYPGRRPRMPTPHELKELEGGQGVLMKVEGADSKVEYYSYFPGLGKIVKEKGDPGEQSNFDDSKYFSPGSKARVPGTYNVFTKFDATHRDRDLPEVTGEGRIPYFSRRNGSLATVVGKFFTKDYGYLKAKTVGETRIEKNTAGNQAVNDFLLSLIPFYDGIKDAITGNVAGAVFNIGFDILGFFLPGASAANKAMKLGTSAGKVLKRSFFAGLGVSVGVTDVINLPRNIKRGVVAVGKDIKKAYKHADEVLPRIKGNYRSYEVTSAYKDGDIVKGFYQVESDGVRRPIVAVLKKGAWYAYNSLMNTPFGPQLAQFGVLSALAPSNKT
ncbi:hypothetical protein ACLBW8_19905 [Pseudomonas sp. M5A4_2d]